MDDNKDGHSTRLDEPNEVTRVDAQRGPRVRMRVDVRAASLDQRFEGTAFNLSHAGMAIYFESDADIEVGTALRIAAADLVDAQASVVWVRRGDRNHLGEEVLAVGVTFDANQDLTRLSEAVNDYRPTVLLVGQDSATSTMVHDALGTRYEVHVAAGADAALDIIDRQEVAVLIMEMQLPETTGSEFLEALGERFPDNHIVRLVLAGSASEESIREFVTEHSLYYFVKKPINADDLIAVVGSAVEEHLRRLNVSGRLTINSVGLHQRILEHSGRLAIQRNLRSATQVAVEAILGLVQAERAYCLSYERFQELLWTTDAQGNERRMPAGRGIAGFAARTGKIVSLPIAGDSRYVAEIDDPVGDGTERLVAVPVNSPDDIVLAVFIAVRSSKAQPFSEEEVEILRNLATQSASAFNRNIFQAHIDGPFSDNRSAHASSNDYGKAGTIFRAEALEDYYGARRSGGVLRVSPRWTVGAFWVLISVFVAALLFVTLGKVSDIAVGPAVVIVDGQTPLTVAYPGTVTAVHVKPGQSVVAGERLIDLDASAEEAEFRRVEKEFKTQLARSLRDPKDEAANAALATLRAQRDLARARLEERIVRAPEAGRISDVRITSGQVAKPGEPLISFVNDDSQYSIVAMIDGEHRPLLYPGMPIKLEFAGYKYAFQTLYVSSISEEVLGPQEARGYLGTSLAETMDITRPVSVVRAKLKRESFTFRGKKLLVHSGMLGNVEITVRRRRIFTLLLPGYSD